MKKLLKLLVFADAPVKAFSANWILLVLRIIVGGMMLVHGCQKVAGYDSLVATFPDPIGLGSALSLQLAILAEFLCSLAVIFGFMFRLALVPIAITMIVAAFVVMAPMGWQGMELPVLYLVLALLLMASGPGRYSLDHFIVCHYLL